jgi:hypothetical protein
MNTPNQGDEHVVQMAGSVPAADQTCIAQCVCVTSSEGGSYATRKG